MALEDNWNALPTTKITPIWTAYNIISLVPKFLKNTATASKQNILPLQNEINHFVVVWIVPMQPQLSKTAMKGKISKN